MRRSTFIPAAARKGLFSRHPLLDRSIALSIGWRRPWWTRVPENVAWNRGCCRTTITWFFSAVLPLEFARTPTRSLRKNYVGTPERQWSARVAQEKNIPAGCSKRLFSKAAASEAARRTLRYVEPLSDARTPLADFFSILLEGVCRCGAQQEAMTIVLFPMNMMLEDH